MVRVAIYNRCSTEDEAQVNALAIQAEESREVAERNGWLITGHYIESESGTTTRKRTEYQKMLEDMEEDIFDVIMIKSIDRLTRSTKDWYLFLDKLIRCRKRLYIYIDRKFYTAEDNLITGIKAILAEDFSRELSKKIRNAHHRRQEKKTGLNITNEMFGWDRISSDRYVINEAEASRYREAFRMVEEGKGFYSIANYMYEQGVRSKNGKRIADVQWRKMIYSPRAYGTVVLHKEEYDFDRKKKIALPPEEWIYVNDALPPIVTRKYHDEIMDILEKRKAKQGHVSRSATGGFSGKIVCASCGSPYYRVYNDTKHGKEVYFRCSGKRRQIPCTCKSVREKDLEQILDRVGNKEFGAFSNSIPALTEMATDMIKTVFSEVHSDGGRKDLGKECQKIEEKKEVLFHMLMEHTISEKDFEKYYGELEQRKQTLEKQEECFQGNRLTNIDKALRMDKVIQKAIVKVYMEALEHIVVYPQDRLEFCFGRTQWNEQTVIVKADYIRENETEQKRREIGDRILKCFQEDPNRKLKDIYKDFDRGESYINGVVKQLKEEGKLQYIRSGNSHTGIWKVTESHRE